MGAPFYMETIMRLIYQNLDRLEVSFQCAVPSGIREQLERAKAEALQARTRAYAEMGSNKLQVMVLETGAKGGYTYQFSTGHDGALWLIGNRDDRNQWNVRVIVSSLCLALYGYYGAKERLLKVLKEDLKAVGPDDQAGEPIERVSRVDYCLDFLLEEAEIFAPNQNNFVCAGRTKKGVILDSPIQLEGIGRVVEYIRIGKMPNRQIVIYNKTREISASHKSFWWQIWDLNKEEIKTDIWRIEIRAGKKELNIWNFRSFKNLEEMLGDVVKLTLEEYRYTEPNSNDLNMTRWPMALIWQMAIKASEKDLLNYSSKASRKKVLNEFRNTVITNYKRLITGIFIGYTAVTGKDIGEIPGVLELVCDEILDQASNNPEKFRQKYKKKMEEFAQLAN